MPSLHLDATLHRAGERASRGDRPRFGETSPEEEEEEKVCEGEGEGACSSFIVGRVSERVSECRLSSGRVLMLASVSLSVTAWIAPRGAAGRKSGRVGERTDVRLRPGCRVMRV